ncbi:MAG: SDR family NAD(P)-dependent oxidoreductase [Actinomycetales bacterium]|nr:SDR family NAD(P)-dependent oxidoreductase [Actinomycetales bacterium]
MTGLSTIAGKVAVVTGGASGIGKGIAWKLRQEGAEVVIADIEAGPLAEAATELGAFGVLTDVTNHESVEALAAATLAEFGRVDIVVNNAGVGPKAPYSELTLSDWRWIMDVNLFGVINGIDVFLELLKANPEGGHIVNTASMAALVPPAGFAPYVASKAAVLGLSETLAKELAAEDSLVGVSVLCPGPVHTNIKNSLRSRPAEFGEKAGLKDVDIAKTMGDTIRWAIPHEVGAIVTRGILAGDLYLLTHPEWVEGVHAHARALDAAFTKYPPLILD